MTTLTKLPNTTVELVLGISAPFTRFDPLTHEPLYQMQIVTCDKVVGTFDFGIRSGKILNLTHQSSLTDDEIAAKVSTYDKDYLRPNNKHLDGW